MEIVLTPWRMNDLLWSIMPCTYQSQGAMAPTEALHHIAMSNIWWTIRNGVWVDEGERIFFGIECIEYWIRS